MKKLLIFGVAGLLLGLGGGVAFAWVRRPEPPAAEITSVSADSAGHAAVDTLAADTPAHHLPGTDSVPALPAHADSAGALDSIAAVATIAPAVRPAVPAEPAADTVGARFARMIGALKPEDAALVLQQLDDGSTRRVLLQLSERKAALILAALPEDRAGAIARALLLPNDE